MKALLKKMERGFFFLLLIACIFSLVRLNICKAADFGIPRGYTSREMFPRGQNRVFEQHRREKLRQLRILEARMPRDIRNMVPVSPGKPGDSRPEIIEFLHRNRTRFVGGGWVWNSGQVSIYPDSKITGPIKGATYPVGGLAEVSVTDPESSSISLQEPIIEWWEVSDRTREQRAEFFRARFGAAQQMQSTGGGATGGGGSMMPGGIGPPGGGMP